MVSAMPDVHAGALFVSLKYFIDAPDTFTIAA